MQGIEYAVIGGVVAVLVLRSPAARRAVGASGRRVIRAAGGRARAGGARLASTRRARAGRGRRAGLGPVPRRLRGLAVSGGRRLLALVWAPRRRPATAAATAPAPPVPPPDAAPAPVRPAGTTVIGDGALILGPADTYQRLTTITDNIGVTVEEFRTLTRAIQRAGAVTIDPKDPEAVEQFLGWLSGLRGALITLGAAITEFAEQSDQLLHLDGRVTSPIYETVASVTDAAMLPQRAAQQLERLYAPQLAAMRAEGVRPAASGFFERQSA